jgi:hypothetical protein
MRNTLAGRGLYRKVEHTITFEGLDKTYVILDSPNLDSIDSYKVKPSSFWSMLFSEYKEPDDDIITEAMVREYLKPRYVRHLLLGDDYAEPANADLLDKQARKLKVASIPYDFPRYDCEDRSFACMGAWHLNVDTAAMSTFIVWVTYEQDGEEIAHALNGFCTKEGIYLYEPALYETFVLPEFWLVHVLVG